MRTVVTGHTRESLDRMNISYEKYYMQPLFQKWTNYLIPVPHVDSFLTEIDSINPQLFDNPFMARLLNVTDSNEEPNDQQIIYANHMARVFAFQPNLFEHCMDVIQYRGGAFIEKGVFDDSIVLSYCLSLGNQSFMGGKMYFINAVLAARHIQLQNHLVSNANILSYDWDMNFIAECVKHRDVASELFSMTADKQLVLDCMSNTSIDMLRKMKKMGISNDDILLSISNGIDCDVISSIFN